MFGPRFGSECVEGVDGFAVKVERKDLKPGDLIFLKLKSRRVNHVAIYLGNDRFIHAPRRGSTVRWASLASNLGYYGARRIVVS